jgi:hypothetical protein
VRKRPNYLYLLLGLAVSISLITVAWSLNLIEVAGVGIGALALVATAYTVTERKRFLVVVCTIGAFAMLPFLWLRAHPGAVSPELANDFYTCDPVLWVMFTVTAIVERGQTSRRRAPEAPQRFASVSPCWRSNE